MRSTPRSLVPVLGEDVLITGAGPIGIMAAAVARHWRRALRRDHRRQPVSPGTRRRMGATLAVNVRETSLAQVQQQLGMTEGFDVGLEMSGNPAAFRDMLANMSHGAKIAMLGIPAEPMPIDWSTVIFSMLTIKGIYGREMYENLVQDERDAAIGSGHQPGDYTPLSVHRVREGLRGHDLGQYRKSHPELGLITAALRHRSSRK
jgi:threonine dehydrogenase-like Zn-dependent dehydrogenase